MRSIHHMVAVAALAACAGTALAQDAGTAHKPAGPATAVSRQPVDTQAMRQLRESADRLRESIQALAGKTPGPDREHALSEAHQALFRTQQAMLALPPELRGEGSVSGSAGYDESVRKLMASADGLRHAVQAMAQQPAGKGRNDAIRQANQALLDTQSAMVSAYAVPGSTQAMGSAPSSSPSGAK